MRISTYHPPYPGYIVHTFLYLMRIIARFVPLLYEHVARESPFKTNLTGNLISEVIVRF